MAFITAQDLRDALNANVFVHIFADDGSGIVDDASSAVETVLERAHVEVISYMPNLYKDLPLDPPTMTLLKSAELDFAYTFALERRPELARSMGDETILARWKRGQERMDRIRKSIQRLTDDAPGGVKPANVGGYVNSGSGFVPDCPRPIFKNGMGDF